MSACIICFMMADSEKLVGNNDGKRDRGPYKRNRKGDRSYRPKQKREEEDSLDSLDNVELTPTILAFKEYQSELDLKHDKYERLVKVSRDITIESKRIIFLLHRIDGDSDKVLKEAESRLKSLQDTLISKIASELKGEDLHQFIRSFSPGLQEYIEAVSFYLFIKEERLVTLDEIISRLTFLERGDLKEVENKEADGVKSQSEVSDSKEKQDQQDALNLTESNMESDSRTLSLQLPPLEYMLGLADFTGELMRMCINIIGSGDLERPFELVAFMRNINRGFQQLGNIAGREMVRKSSVMRQSLKKMEDACYVIKVRGSEIPKHMLKDMAFSSDFSSRDDDYGQDMMN